VGKDNEISVVMAVYKNDNKTFFKEAVESLLLQTYLPSEIIIVVDGFVNKEIDTLLVEFSSNTLIKIVRLAKNNGLANALNVGIQEAKYPLIARMDSDDICFKDRFEKQIKYIVKGNLDMVGGQIIEFGKDIEDIVSERKVPIRHQEMVRFMKLRSPFSHPTIIFKKTVFLTLGGYDITIFPEDYDFFVRAYLKGFKFGNVDQNILWFRLGEDRINTIKRRWGKTYAINEYRLYKKFLKLGFFNYSDFFKAVVLKIPLRILPFSIYKFIYFKILRTTN
jgi:glycosyltransferase involved in cell wall biosynthesis